ncbi:MAG: pilus assembly protein [Marinicaulis sp.]|nr:pilus assembly protein [Marinicaulis sp.]NNE41202.1 pilus assembly protein [Marinicaulis sp.]NNL88370.1 pilus assembly protein [Marinicaulis sp.]
MNENLKRIFSNFPSDRKGTPALEFALIAPLFFAVVFGTFELGRGMYDKNRVAAAAALASRSLAMNPSATDSELETKILDKLDDFDPNDVTITLTNETIASHDFKKIEISYDFEYLINFGSHFSGVTITATRYAPMYERT